MMIPTTRSLLAVVFLAVFAIFPCRGRAKSAPSGDWKVASASEVEGKLRIVLRNGRSFTVEKAEDQCSFDNVQIAPDGVTVGWTEGGALQDPSDKPCRPDAQYVAAGPAVWRAGKIIRRFKEWGGMMDWSFIGGGGRIAVHAGPTHFDDELGVALYDVASGRRLKTWRTSDKTKQPKWAAEVVGDVSGDDTR